MIPKIASSGVKVVSSRVDLVIPGVQKTVNYVSANKKSLAKGLTYFSSKNISYTPKRAKNKPNKPDFNAALYYKPQNRETQEKNINSNSKINTNPQSIEFAKNIDKETIMPGVKYPAESLKEHIALFEKENGKTEATKWIHNEINCFLTRDNYNLNHPYPMLQQSPNPTLEEYEIMCLYCEIYNNQSER